MHLQYQHNKHKFKIEVEVNQKRLNKKPINLNYKINHLIQVQRLRQRIKRNQNEEIEKKKNQPKKNDNNDNNKKNNNNNNDNKKENIREGNRQAKQRKRYTI